MTGKTRRVDIDLLRVIGILFVVAYHYGAIPSELFAVDYFRSILSICVPVFFFVTGVLYSSREFPLRKGVHKALKLVVLTSVWGTVLWISMAKILGKSVTLGSWVSGVLTLEQGVINHLWFLPSIAILYLLLPFFCALQRDEPRLFNGLCALSLFFAFGLDALSRLINLPALFAGAGLSTKLSTFMYMFSPLKGIHGESVALCLAGMWISGRESLLIERVLGCGDRASKIRRALFALVIVFACPAVLAMDAKVRFAFTGEAYDPTWGGYTFAGTFVLVAALYLMLFRARAVLASSRRVAKAISRIGGNTLAIYLLHPLLRTVTYSTILSVYSPIDRLAVGMLASLASCVCFAIIGALLTKTRPGKWLLTV